MLFYFPQFFKKFIFEKLKKTIIFELAISAIIDNESSRISINLVIKFTSFYSFLPKEFYRIMPMSAITEKYRNVYYNGK